MNNEIGFFEWVDSSSDSFLLTITDAVIYVFFDLWIYIINGLDFSWDDGYVPVCYGIMSRSISTIWHNDFDNDIISRIKRQVSVVEFYIILYNNTDKDTL